MANNMRKMFTEEQIGEIAKSSVSGGTKLYLHHLKDTTAGLDFYIISTETEPFVISDISSYEDLWDYLLNFIIISFKDDKFSNIVYTDKKQFAYVYINNDGTVGVTFFDDWDLSTTTDTVTTL